MKTDISTPFYQIPPVMRPVLRRVQRRVGDGRIIRAVVGDFLEELHRSGFEVTIKRRAPVAARPAGGCGRLLTVRGLAKIMRCPRREVEDMLVTAAVEPVKGRKYSVVDVSRAASDVYERMHGVSLRDEARKEAV